MGMVIIPEGFSGIYTGGIGAHNHLAALSHRRADSGWNLFNQSAVLEAVKLGNGRVTLSPELTIEEINALLKTAACEVMVYGRLPLMQLVHCPRKAAGANCKAGICQGDDAFTHMVDQKGETFLLKKSRLARCTNQLLNAHVLHLAPHICKIQGAEALRMLMTDENPGQVAALVRGYRSVMRGENADFPLSNVTVTAGHAFRGVE
jgi:collagenase-like PrtC family protease